ncbi:MAG: helix-turn-helix domain-containing protein [Lachnospiraceae bacterium]
MNIKEMRELTGETQKEFAKRFDIPLGTLRRWEYGESTPAPYVIKLIAQQLPIDTNRLKVIDDGKGTKFYYDNENRIIIDRKGTRIKVNESVDTVKEQNLFLYTKDLFETYYELIEKFDRDCRLDKQEDIIWG